MELKYIRTEVLTRDKKEMCDVNVLICLQNDKSQVHYSKNVNFRQYLGTNKKKGEEDVQGREAQGIP